MSGFNKRKIVKAKRRRAYDTMEVDEDPNFGTTMQTVTLVTAMAPLMAQPTAPLQQPSIPPHQGPVTGAVQQQIPGPLMQLFDVNQPAGTPLSPLKTYAGQFLSQSAGVVSSQQRPAMLNPSSLQSFSSATEIITMKDENGIVRSYPVDNPTYTYVRSLLSARISAPQVPGASATPTTGIQVSPSLGSLPSGSSVYSSASSVSSQLSQSSFSTTPGRNPAVTLQVLYSMLDDAKMPDDIAEVKMRIKQTLYDMEEEEKWKKHLSGEVSHCAENGTELKGILSERKNYNNKLIVHEPRLIQCETSSAKCNQGILVSKPKKGFFT